MTENAGKLQIVLKGGKPWGFHLKNYSENRSTVVVDNMEPGGKAQMHGGLKVGDHVIKINDVLCLSLADAIQLIDSAFRTLTILVWRPSSCTQSKESVYNNVDLQNQNSSSPAYSPSINKLNGSFFQKFNNFKCNTANPKQNDKPVLNCNSSKSDNSASSRQYQFSDFTNASLQHVNKQQRSSVHKLSPTEFVNRSKHKFQSNSVSKLECFNPMLSQSHQNANLQYICEQYPLSELFLNYKSDLKLESLASHSKRFLKTYQKQEIGLKPSDSTRYYQETSVSKESNSSKSLECVCCMYPKCHSSYKMCKMHSPPERDLAESQTKFVDNSVSSQYINYEENFKSNLISSHGSSEDHSAKRINCMLAKNSLKIKEDGFKNSDLKVFKPIELSLESKPISFKSYELRSQRRDDIFYQEQVSHLKFDKNKSNDSPKYHVQDSKEQNYNGCSSKTFKLFSSEVIPETSEEHAFLISHSEQNKAILYGQNTVQEETTFELYNQNSSSGTKTSFQRSYLEEKEHSVILTPPSQWLCSRNPDELSTEPQGSVEHTLGNAAVEYSNGASIMNVLSTGSSISDGDEDEELCLIEENARNNYSCITPHYSSVTLDLALSPPPPPINDDTEIFATNEPLPSPPSFSPVKEIIYENIEINKKPDEAIYANLEMLKIKCSVVNSATQTSSQQKPTEHSYLDSKQLSKSFSIVETEIFSNIIAPTFGNKFRSDYLRSFLQSQLEKHSPVVKENIQKTEEKYSIESHALSLPLTSAYFTTSEPKAKLLTRYINNLNDRNAVGSELTDKKEELMTSINKKLGILRLEQIALKEEMKQNDELGCSLARKLGKLAQANEMDKFKVHVEELEKITNLMISLSGRLARAENALLILPFDASSEEKNILEGKYSKLKKQYEEANYLKKSIDRRNCHVSLFLRKYFTEEEFTDYDHFITMKAKLLMDYREIDEKIKLGEEQLDALKGNVNSKSFSKLRENSCD